MLFMMVLLSELLGSDVDELAVFVCFWFCVLLGSGRDLLLVLALALVLGVKWGSKSWGLNGDQKTDCSRYGNYR